MSYNAVTPILATGGLVIAGGWRREQGWPKEGVKAIAATIVLVIVASATNNSKINPIIAGLAWLTFMGAVYATVPVFNKPVKKG